jgi:phosphoglycerate dehydrogenase-like enzyme
MENMLIVVTPPSFSKNKTLRGEISRYFSNVKFNDSGDKLEGEGLIDFIGDAEGLIVGLEKIDREAINRLAGLRIISKYGVGLDNIDTQYCSQKGIIIGWTPGTNKTSVAEMTIAIMIALSRNIFSTSSQLKNGTWNKNGGNDLSGKTVGIIGIGNVGKEVIRFLKPFRNRVLVNDIIDQAKYYHENDLIEATKEEIYRRSDIVTLHVPLTDNTICMIDRKVFSQMKKSGFLINTSRGKVVEQDSLKWALMNGIIAGAAIDVYEEEPPEDNELLGFPNLICTPHIGGNSVESVLAMGRSAINHLVDFFKK